MRGTLSVLLLGIVLLLVLPTREDDFQDSALSHGSTSAPIPIDQGALSAAAPLSARSVVQEAGEVPSLPPADSLGAATATQTEVQKNQYLEPQNKPQELVVSPAPPSLEDANAHARAALVNIFCTNPSGIPISGSGIMIDPRGIVLTNAHVAQYVLLAETGLFGMECSIRTGTPARAAYGAAVLLLPRAWAEQHAQDLASRSRTGTGEHDWALIRAISASPPIPFLSPHDDVFVDVGESVLSAGYPAEFIGSALSYEQLHAASSVTSIQALHTFGTSTIDVVAIGSPIAAQAGSSGGPVVDARGHLLGMITTTSAGFTTGERSLSALTLRYITEDMLHTSGLNLAGLNQMSTDTLEQRFEGVRAEVLAMLLAVLGI